MNGTVLLTTIIIFAVLIRASLGKKEINNYRLLLPIPVLLFFSFSYLKYLTFEGNNSLILVVSVMIGVVLGFALLVTTKVEYDQTSRKFYSMGSPLSIVVWVIAFLLRLVPVEVITRFPEKSYTFSVNHHFQLSIIGPAFILMTIAILGVRIFGILQKAKNLRNLEQNF